MDRVERRDGEDERERTLEPLRPPDVRVLQERRERRRDRPGERGGRVHAQGQDREARDRVSQGQLAEVEAQTARDVELGLRVMHGVEAP